MINLYKSIFEDAGIGYWIWNLSDKSTWLDSFPFPGRKDYPLLFDKELHPKKVYYEVIKVEPVKKAF